MSKKSSTFAVANWVTLQNRVQSYNKKMKNTNYSVKKYQTYGILLLALLFCGSVEAKVYHYVGGYGQLGEWSLMPKSSAYSSSLGAAGGLGISYEMQYVKGPTPFRVLANIGVGATFGTTAYSKTTSATERMEKQTDLDGKPFEYIYDIRDRKDKYNNFAVHIPIMLGFQYRRLYVLAGVKVYANMWTQTKTTATLTTYGEYWDAAHKVKIYDDFRSMPEYQFFTDEKLKKKTNTNLNLDADLCLEIGARLGVINYATGYDVPKRILEYRIGAFVDYGLFDVHTNGTKKTIVFPERYDVDATSPNYVHGTRTMIDNLQMNDVMATEGFAKKVQNLMIGVKFTVLFQMPQQQKCVMCADGYQSTANPARGSRGMKYEE